MKRIIQFILNQFGYSIYRIKKPYTSPFIINYNKENLLRNFFEILLKINFKVNHIVDVGANRGTWTREILKYYPNSYFTLLEPQYWMKNQVEDLMSTNPKINFLSVGAGSTEGTFKFTLVDRDDSCSFRYNEQEAKDAGFKQIETKVTTLNKLVKESDFPFPEIIKIDAEGLDLSVLAGASELFGKVEIFMVEAGIVNKSYDNSLLKLCSFMDEKGYNLFDITDLNRPFITEVLWLVELVFVRKNGIIDSIKWQ